MASWVSIAVTAALSVILASIFLLARYRRTGRPFGPRSMRSVITVIVFTGAASTGLGLVLTVVSHQMAMIYVGLFVPNVLWLTDFLLRSVDRQFDDDMQDWCDARVRAVSAKPQWIADAVTYHDDQVRGGFKDRPVPTVLSRWRESITHKIGIVRLIKLDATPARLQESLRMHPSTANISRFEVDDLPRLARRLEAEALNELHLFLAYLYRLGYRKLLVYPFQAPQRGPSTRSAHIPEGVPPPKQRWDLALAETSGSGESDAHPRSLRDIPASGTVDNHTSAGSNWWTMVRPD